jgi:hypothetical protein
MRTTESATRVFVFSGRLLTAGAHLSLAAGYCAVAKRNGKQPAKAKAEP